MRRWRRRCGGSWSSLRRSARYRLGLFYTMMMPMMMMMMLTTVVMMMMMTMMMVVILTLIHISMGHMGPANSQHQESWITEHAEGFGNCAVVGWWCVTAGGRAAGHDKWDVTGSRGDAALLH